MPRKILVITIDITNRQGAMNLQQLLDTLDRLGVRATFYMPGYIIEQYEKIIKRITSSKHEVGVSGYSGKRLDKMATIEAVNDIAMGIAVLSRYTKPKSFRAPYMKLPRQILCRLPAMGLDIDSSVSQGIVGLRKRVVHLECGVVRVAVTKTGIDLLSRMPSVNRGIEVYRINLETFKEEASLERFSKTVLEHLSRGYEALTISEAVDTVIRVPPTIT